jgi:hypothetical protein
MSELDVLAANLQWMRDHMESQDRMMAEIFERLRHIENELASIKANERPPLNGWTVFGIVAASAVSILLVIDRFVN